MARSLHNFSDVFQRAHMSASGNGLLVPGVGYLFAWGTTVPTDETAGYAPGCIFIHTDGSGASDVVYKNVGTYASCNFDTIETAA